jgi:hypothetical protein
MTNMAIVIGMLDFMVNPDPGMQPETGQIN